MGIMVYSLLMGHAGFCPSTVVVVITGKALCKPVYIGVRVQGWGSGLKWGRATITTLSNLVPLMSFMGTVVNNPVTDASAAAVPLCLVSF